MASLFLTALRRSRYNKRAKTPASSPEQKCSILVDDGIGLPKSRSRQISFDIASAGTTRRKVIDALRPRRSRIRVIEEYQREIRTVGAALSATLVPESAVYHLDGLKRLNNKSRLAVIGDDWH